MHRIFSGFLLFAFVCATPGYASHLVPHQAIYEIELKEAAERSGVEGASGGMVIDILGGKCDGWTVEFQMVTQYLLPRNKARSVDSRSSSWESFDGLEMRLSQRQFIDGRLEDQFLVRASKPADTASGHGVLQKPKVEAFKKRVRTCENWRFEYRDILYDFFEIMASASNEQALDMAQAGLDALHR